MGQRDRRTDQARRQKIKWGCALVKKWKMGGGVFCKKSGPFLNAGCIMYSISFYFILHFIYLGVRPHPTDPLPTGLQTDTVPLHRRSPLEACSVKMPHLENSYTLLA